MTMNQWKIKRLQQEGATKIEHGWNCEGYILQDKTIEKLPYTLLVKCLQFYQGKIPEKELDDEIKLSVECKRAEDDIKKYGYKTVPFFIAQINPKTTDEYLKKISGYEFYFMASCNGEDAIFCNPINPEKVEEYWKVQFEELKEWVSDDFKDFMDIMLEGNGAIPTAPLKELLNFRYVREEDIKSMNEGIEKMIEKYGLEYTY